MKKSILMMAAFACLGAWSETYTWQGGASGVWNSNANWSPSGVPNAGDVALFPVAADITDDIALGEGTLIITNDVADLHLRGVISGAGGISIGGAGETYLYSSNTFEGPFVSEGTGKTTAGLVLNPSSPRSGGVTIYNCGALGRHSATFDPNGDNTGQTTPKADGSPNPQAVDAHSGATLTVKVPGTIDIPLALSLDKPNAGSLVVDIPDDRGDVILQEKVTCRFRLRIMMKTANALHVMQETQHSNYITMDVVAGADIYLHGKESGSVATYGQGQIHFCSDQSTSINVFNSSHIVCEVENALPRTLNYLEFNADGCSIDFGGHDQLVTSLVTYRYKELSYNSRTNYGFRSASPAQIRFVGTDINSFGYRGALEGAAGIEWDPQQTAREFTYSNSVATTCGSLTVKSGSFRLSQGATFPNLGSLTVAAGAVFKVETGSAANMVVTNVIGETGAVFELGDKVNILVSNLSLGGVELDNGSYSKVSHPDFFRGAGTITVRKASETIVWKGASGGRWDDPENWDSSTVPGAGQAALIAGDVKVILDATPAAAPKIVSVGAGATLVFTNWNTQLNADFVDVLAGGTITCAGPVTNETDMSRVNIVCGELLVAQDGVIDVSTNGWEGGRWDFGAMVKLNYSFGPGSASGYAGSSHGGHGTSYHVEFRPGETYDNPYAPTQAGSGGEMPHRWGSAWAHSGGGVVRIQATRRVRVDGKIAADGASASPATLPSYNHDAAASGGSVWITCGHIEGSGLVSARGGDGQVALYPSPLLMSNGKTPSCDQALGPAGGGGMIAVETTDATSQASAYITGLRLTAAGGGYPLAALGCTTPATADKYNTQAEAGTLVVTDDGLRTRLIGKGLSGQLLGVDSFTHDGDFEWNWGHVRFPVDGFVFKVTGDLTISSAEARLDLGDVCWTNKRCAVTDYWGGNTPSRLEVGGDFTVTEGAAFQIRAAETNRAKAVWGGEVQVGGKLTVGENAYVYAACDPVNFAVPHFTVGALDVQAGGTFSADNRGCAGGWGSTGENTWMGGAHYQGFSPLAETALRASGGAHGGEGGLGVAASGAFNAAAKKGMTYDDPYRPSLPGAGGNSNGWGVGGKGGGVVHVESLGGIVVNGTVSADGGMSGYWYFTSASCAVDNVGGGAGGTVYLCGDTISGTGRISACGGAGANFRNTASGAGGGGRIALITGNGGRAQWGDMVRYGRLDEAPVACSFAGVVDMAGGTNAYARVGEPTVERRAAFGMDGTVKWGIVQRAPGLRVFMR